MKDPTGRSPVHAVSRSAYRPGTYLRCGACGRLLKIEWATRSIVCACGARINPTPGK
jgi:hypothetical protein